MGSGGARVSLAAENVVYIKKDGVNLTPNADETLWFSDNNPAGDYVFEVLTTGGGLYTATLEWIPTP